MSRKRRPQAPSHDGIAARTGGHSAIYMDHNATTPLDPRVFEAMAPFLTDAFGNAASRSHSFGHQAERAIEAARSQVAEILNATEKEIIYTSGATEANNL